MSMYVMYLPCIAPSLWYLNTMVLYCLYFYVISGPFALWVAQYKGAASSYSL